MKIFGGEITQSQVRLVQTVVVPSGKVKFVEAKLDVPLIEGEELLFEPDVEVLSKFGLVAPEALLTLKSHSSVLVPVENYDALAARMDANVVLGQVVRPNFAVLSAREDKSLTVEVEPATSSTVSERKRRLEMLGLKPGDGGMTIEQCEQLKRFLEENHDVFSIDGELGRTRVVQHVIDTGNHPLLNNQLDVCLLFIERKCQPWSMTC